MPLDPAAEGSSCTLCLLQGVTTNQLSDDSKQKHVRNSHGQERVIVADLRDKRQLLLARKCGMEGCKSQFFFDGGLKDHWQRNPDHRHKETSEDQELKDCVVAWDRAPWCRSTLRYLFYTARGDGAEFFGGPNRLQSNKPAPNLPPQPAPKAAAKPGPQAPLAPVKAKGPPKGAAGPVGGRGGAIGGAGPPVASSSGGAGGPQPKAPPRPPAPVLVPAAGGRGNPLAQAALPSPAAGSPATPHTIAVEAAKAAGRARMEALGKTDLVRGIMRDFKMGGDEVGFGGIGPPPPPDDYAAGRMWVHQVALQVESGLGWAATPPSPAEKADMTSAFLASTGHSSLLAARHCV